MTDNTMIEPYTNRFGEFGQKLILLIRKAREREPGAICFDNDMTSLEHELYDLLKQYGLVGVRNL